MSSLSDRLLPSEEELCSSGVVNMYVLVILVGYNRCLESLENPV
jgi:hypothetical protein